MDKVQCGLCRLNGVCANEEEDDALLNQMGYPTKFSHPQHVRLFTTRKRREMIGS